MGSHALASGEVLVSGASGGKARFIPYSHDDWQNMIQQGVQTLYDVGLVAGDRVINTLYGGHMYGGMLTSSQELALMPIQSYTAGQGIKPEELVELRRTFKINAIIGIPDDALRLPDNNPMDLWAFWPGIGGSGDGHRQPYTFAVESSGY
ncbi:MULTISPECIES: hypothetical protein [unclassified Pantoea]|uniref:hypothetical protein n=1 Tax=unclassified Pantoea TaxID=2630326 RepID=UPI002269DC1D|nr:MULTISPECIES: hypothetical protein [unclassified Pantoea]